MSSEDGSVFKAWSYTDKQRKKIQFIQLTPDDMSF